MNGQIDVGVVMSRAVLADKREDGRLGQHALAARADGSPYLEPHHTRRFSDGGPDHPRFVGGICPNCHREAHHGAEGTVLNERLQARLDELEAGPGPGS